MGNTFVLLYVHLENDLFYISFSSTLYQGSTLSLTFAVTYPYCFLTAYKRLCCLPVLAGTSDSKKPDPYYSVM